MTAHLIPSHFSNSFLRSCQLYYKKGFATRNKIQICLAVELVFYRSWNSLQGTIGGIIKEIRFLYLARSARGTQPAARRSTDRKHLHFGSICPVRITNQCCPLLERSLQTNRDELLHRNIAADGLTERWILAVSLCVMTLFLLLLLVMVFKKCLDNGWLVFTRGVWVDVVVDQNQEGEDHFPHQEIRDLFWIDVTDESPYLR